MRVLVVVLLDRRFAPTSGWPAATPRRTGGVAPAAALELVVGEARHLDGHVAGALPDARAPPTSAWPPPLQRRPVVGERAGDEQLVLRQAVVALGVGNGRIEQLQHVARGTALAVPQLVASRFDVEPADEPQDLADLRRRRAQVAEGSSSHRRVDRS
jgi:hypothetical protein